MTAALSLPLPDLDDEPEDTGAEADLRVSFFTAANVDAPLSDGDAWDAIEDADEAVCASVWAIFARESTARGFDARSARSKSASKALARRRATNAARDGAYPWKQKTIADHARVAAKVGRASKPAKAAQKGIGR